MNNRMPGVGRGIQSGRRDKNTGFFLKKPDTNTTWFLFNATWFKTGDRSYNLWYSRPEPANTGERISIMELEMINLSRQFKKIEAVKCINARLTPGVWGLLGANGAGKTTMMRMMAGILKPSHGQVTFCGRDIRNNSSYRAVFGFLPQEIQFSRDLTVIDYLNYVAALKNVAPDLTKERIDKLLAVLTLEDVRNKKIVKLSGGMKRRVGIAQAMLNDPSVLILDEPTAGLDPGERIRFRNFLSATSSEKIIILSTHIVSDIEDIADHVMIMKDGELNRIVGQNDYDELEKLYISIFMEEALG